MLTCILMPAHSHAALSTIHVCWLANGVSSAGKNLLGFVYCYEFLPESMHSIAGTIGCSLDGIVIVLTTLLYRYALRHWKTVVIIGLAQNAIGLVAHVFFVPESPKWLFETGRNE